MGRRRGSASAAFGASPFPPRRETSHVLFRRSPILLLNITGDVYLVSMNSGHITLSDDNAVLDYLPANREPSNHLVTLHLLYSVVA